MSQSDKTDRYDFKKKTGCVGLYNQGATCYMNSLLQLLFHTTYFRAAVYGMSTTSDDTSEIPRALQNLFFQLQERADACSTKRLTDAFGWDEREVFVQHDIQELAALLRDCLEKKMKGTPSEGAINRLFTGYGEKYFECLDKSYISRNRDVFYDIHIPISGYRNLNEAMKSLIQTEKLTGDNKYKVEIEGKKPEYKDAETGYRYLRFPPVIFFHLKRFEMDMYSPTLEMKKVNTAFEYPTSLDLSSLEAGLDPDDEHTPSDQKSSALDQQKSFMMTDAKYELYGIIVHRGGVRSGHYFMYCRNYDFKADAWKDWMEFDDDHVRFVEDGVAVNRNFGGYVRNSYGQEMLSGQNAYMLAYVRKEDIPKVLFPTDTTSIPADVKGVFERILREEEAAAQEEELRNKRCTFQIITDDHIRDSVRSHTLDLVPSNYKSNMSFVVEKSQHLKDVYAEVQKQLGIEDPTQIRLWLWAYHYPNHYTSWRPTGVITALKDLADDATVGKTILAMEYQTQADADRAWNMHLYVEIARVHEPPAVTNAALFAKNLKMSTCTTKAPDAVSDFDPTCSVKEAKMAHFAADDKKPTFRVEFPKALTISGAMFRWIHQKNVDAYRATLQLEAFGPNGNSITTVTRDYRIQFQRGNEHVWLTFEKPVECVAVEISRLEAKTERDTYYYDSNHLEPFGLSRVKVFAPEEELQEFMPPRTNQPALPVMEKRHRVFCPVKYFNPKTGVLSYMGTCVLPGLELLRNSYPTLAGLCGLDPKSKLMVFEESKPTDVSELSGDMYPACLNTNSLIHGSTLIVQPHPSELSFLIKSLRADSFARAYHDQRLINIRKVSEPDTVVATISMSARWRYNFVCDAISNRIGVKPDYIRLFAPKDASHNPRPNTEPERSDSTHNTLDSMTRVGHFHATDIFFDVLSIPLDELEHQVEVKCSYSTELGEAVHPSQDFLLPLDATVNDLVRHLLQKVDVPFDKPHVLVEMRNHVVQSYYPTNPEGTTKESQTRVSDMFRRHYHYDISAFDVRPFSEPGAEELVVPVAHGEFLGDRQSECFGMPILFTVKKTETVSEVHLRLNDIFKPDEKELKDPKYRLMLVTDCTLNFPDFDLTLAAYVKHTKNHSTKPTSCLFNRKRPREKPGSRYVAQNDPQLVLEKKKKPASGSSPQSSAQ